jgi:hypothetical protein
MFSCEEIAIPSIKASNWIGTGETGVGKTRVEDKKKTGEGVVEIKSSKHHYELSMKVEKSL